MMSEESICGAVGESACPESDHVRDQGLSAMSFVRENYVYSLQNDEVLDLRTEAKFKPHAFVRRFEHLDMPAKTTVYDFIFKGPQCIEKVDSNGFFPGQSCIVQQKDGVRYYNHWLPTCIEPETGDITPFLGHVSYLFDNDPVMVPFVLDWCAWCIQFPQIKQSTAILLTSS